MNNVNLIGTMVKDIELKQYNNNTRGFLRIAVNKEFKNKNGEVDSNFFNVSVWNGTADFLAKYASKGTTIAIVGRLDSYTRKDDNGNTIGDVVTIEATNVEIVRKPKGQQEQDMNAFDNSQKVSQSQNTQQYQSQQNYPINDLDDEDLPF